MADLRAAVTYITQHGNNVEQARLRHLLTGEPADPEVIGTLLAGQRPDGGWNPFWAPDYSSLDATCFRLAQAEQLGLTGANPAVGRALRFLAGRQRDDGSWEEAEAVRGLAPPWAAPGDPAARLYLTANCGFWLALLGDTSGGAARAARFLHGQLAPGGSLPTFAHAHWLAAGLWRRLGDHEPAERVLQHLGGQLGPDFPPYQQPRLAADDPPRRGRPAGPCADGAGRRPPRPAAGSRRALAERGRPDARRACHAGGATRAAPRRAPDAGAVSADGGEGE